MQFALKNDKNCYPKVLLEKYKYKEKKEIKIRKHICPKKQISKYISDELEILSNDSNDKAFDEFDKCDN